MQRPHSFARRARPEASFAKPLERWLALIEGAGDRISGDREACPNLRLAFDVHLERSRERSDLFETARIAGTSVKMIERHYGALIDTERESLLERLEASQ